jgi:quaternary ammonium compound-resistance protein SugE
MSWIFLFIAGLLEIGWAVGLKYTEGFTRAGASILTIATMIASVVLLAIAVKSIPVGTAYAVWTGIGVAGTAIIGMLLLGESTGALRILFISLIIVGAAGLKMVSEH